MADLFDNPMGLMGFEFVEFASPQPGTLEPVFEKLGFTLVAKHRSKDVVLFRQGDINFIVNREPKSYAGYFAAEHGPSACGLAFRVRDSHQAYSRALELGAQPLEMPTGPMELRLPAIKGIGGAPLYLIDRFEDGKSIYDIDFEFLPGVDRRPVGHGLKTLDHLTHNVYRGRMAFWAEFLRAPVQLPRDPLLRHPGRVHRPDVEGDDRARRQDPHPAQRGIEEGLRADRGVPDEVQRRGHPARRPPHRRPARDDRQALARRRAAAGGAERRLLRDARAAPARPRRERRRAARRAASSSTAAPKAASRACCCRSSRRPCSARCSSSSSRGKATKASAKATSRRCSNRSSATRCGAACSRRHERATLPVPVGLRQRVRDRGAAGRAAGRPQLAAARALRPLRRAAERHRVHRAARRQPAQLALPHPAGGDAPAVRAHRRRPHRRPLRRGRGDAEPAALEPDADADRADRLRRRPGDDGGQRRTRGADRRGGAPLRRQPLDERSAPSTTPTPRC